ncbi:MAG: TAT-variant-translocated molybdopterin oxidoreductase, partial [Candidatus Margulisbacteria bacterium]|nr:TAT-variant-translocated molybdopterin oxidoreductase [Candidatus Margulisiibacteriota bacterium]
MSSIKKDKKKFWRSQNDIDSTPEFKQFMHREFQEGASELTDPISRRTFLKMMGASMALAGVTGCDSIRKPVIKARPYAKIPENVIPGKSLYYATTMSIGEDVTGILCESAEGRPTKIEGNPLHPHSLGGTKPFQQASILDLYDPDRIQNPLFKNQISDLSSFNALLRQTQRSFRKNQGKGLAILTTHETSPTFYRLLKKFQALYPQANVYKYDPINRDKAYQGLNMITNDWINPQYDFRKANTIVSFDSDFLGNDVDSIRHTKAFSKRRDPDQHMNRLYTFESNYTITGSQSDHRIPLKPTHVENALWLVAYTLFKKAPHLFKDIPASIRSTIAKGAVKSLKLVPEKMIKAIVLDLISQKGKSILIAGPHQSATAHGLIYLLNKSLRNSGVVSYKKRPFSNMAITQVTNNESLSNLLSHLQSEKLDTLFILGGDPANQFPGKKELFSTALSNCKTTIHLTSLRNHTSTFCD